MAQSFKRRIKQLRGMDKDYLSYKAARELYKKYFDAGRIQGSLDSILAFKNPALTPPEWPIIQKYAFADGYNTSMAERKGMQWNILTGEEGMKNGGTRYLGSFHDKDYHKDKEEMYEQLEAEFAERRSTIKLLPAKSECWKVEIDEVKECGKHDKDSLEPLVFTSEVYGKIRGLMAKFPSSEWLAFLKEENGLIVDLMVPKQKVSAGSVDVDPSDPLASDMTNGVIHSHNTMGAFFSGTDDSYLNNTYAFSIVVAKKGRKLEFKGVRKITLPCGSLFIPEVDIQLAAAENTAFLESVLPNIEEKTFYTPAKKDDVSRVSDYIPPRAKLWSKLITRKELEEAAKEFTTIDAYLKKEWGE